MLTNQTENKAKSIDLILTMLTSLLNFKKLWSNIKKYMQRNLMTENTSYLKINCKITQQYQQL
jgi:hypothetical protein